MYYKVSNNKDMLPITDGYLADLFVLKFTPLFWPVVGGQNGLWVTNRVVCNFHNNVKWPHSLFFGSFAKADFEFYSMKEQHRETQVCEDYILVSAVNS